MKPPEQRLIERIYSLEKLLNGVSGKLETLEERMDEMHKDVRGLLSFRANLLGWAAGISGAISLFIGLVLWLMK